MTDQIVSLREMVKTLVEEELTETSTSADAGFYNIPAAFRGNSAAGKAKQKKNATQAGYTVVKAKTDDADSMGKESHEDLVTFGEGDVKKPVVEITGDLKITGNGAIKVNEGYADFKQAEGTPKQKIGRAIKEINKQINEINKVVKMSARLKQESNLNTDSMWKSTTESLNMLESKLNVLSSRIRELKS